MHVCAVSRRSERPLRLGAMLAVAMLPLEVHASYASDAVDLSVRLNAASVSQLNLTVMQGCIASLDGFAPVYQTVSLDALCVLQGKTPLPRGLQRATFQLHGYFPFLKAPDADQPHSLTEEDKKVLETLGPMTEPAVSDFPIIGQVTSPHRMTPSDEHDTDSSGREFYWSADTVWLDSSVIRSLPMDCITMWQGGPDASRLEPNLSKCHVSLNYDGIELIATMDITAPVSVTEIEKMLATFEATVVRGAGTQAPTSE